MALPHKIRMPKAEAIKGRGAASQVSGRFEKTVSAGEDDGWGSLYASDDTDPAAAPRTEVRIERARSIISPQRFAGCRLLAVGQPVSRV